MGELMPCCYGHHGELPDQADDCQCRCHDAAGGVKVYFNPWAFTIEQNNEFLAKGYEVMPIQIPRGRG